MIRQKRLRRDAGWRDSSFDGTLPLPVNSPIPVFSACKTLGRGPLVVLALVVTVLAIYGQTVAYPFIGFDDPGYVYNNAHVRAGLSWAGVRWALTTFQQSNWHPLTWLSLMLDAQIYGLRPGGFHLTNLLLHAANTLLLFRWLRQNTRDFWPPALVAFFFAAHPLHVESVAWVTERKDVLSTCFFFLTLFAYSRYAREQAAGGPKRWRFYGLALGLYALGLCAKPMLVTLPPLLLLLDGWPLERWTPATWRARGPRLLAEKLPFGVLMAASCALTYLAQRHQAVVSLALLPAGFRLASAALGIGTYLQMTGWPVHLGIFYPYWYTVPLWCPLLWAAGLLGLTAATLRQASRRPYLAVGWLWFVGTLVPVIGLVQVGSQSVADRYTYLPHIGLFVAVCWAGQAAWRRWPRARTGLAGLTALAAAACVALGVRQARYWQSGPVLFARTIAVTKTPSARLYQLYADALADAPGREAEAIRAYEQAWRLGGDGQTRDVALRLSALWFQAGRYEEVIHLLDPRSRPADADEELLHTLAAALLRTGQLDRALALYRRCVARDPEDALGHLGAAECLRLQGDVPDACDEYEAGLARDGDRLPVLAYLAWTYAHLDDPAARARALTLARRAVDVGRGRDLASLNALAAAEAACGHWPRAVETARDALTLARQAGGSAGTTELCRTRLAGYEQGQLP